MKMRKVFLSGILGIGFAVTALCGTDAMAYEAQTHKASTTASVASGLPQAGADALKTSAAGAASETATGARNFIDNMGQRALSFLGNQEMTQDQKKQEFRKLLRDSFDMATIGRFALGRNWRIATPQQRTEYQKLFETTVVNVYAARFDDYQGQRFEVGPFRPDAERDTLVTSYIVPQEGPKVVVDWRVRYKDGRYKVVDVVVEGVSMAVTQRSDFSSVIQRGGGNVQVLIDHLKAQNR